MRIAINTDIIIFTVHIPYRYTARGANIYENLILRHKKLRRRIFREASFPSYPGITIKFTEANIHMKKLLPLQKDMRQSVLL